MEIVLDIALVRMPAGEAGSCIPQRAEPAAVLAGGGFVGLELAGGAFYGLFLVFHYAVSFLFSSFFRFSMWCLTKMWKLSSRYVCLFSSISCMASFCC